MNPWRRNKAGTDSVNFRNYLTYLMAAALVWLAAAELSAQQDEEPPETSPAPRPPTRPVPLRPTKTPATADPTTPTPSKFPTVATPGNIPPRPFEPKKTEGTEAATPSAPARPTPAPTPAPTPSTTPQPRPFPTTSGPKARPGTGAEEEPEEGPPAFETGLDFEPVSPRTKVTFNLEEADLPDLVRLISNMTGRRFILPGKTRSIKATVFAPTKVTAAEAYNAFLAVLEVNGLNVVRAGRYYKIVEMAGIENQPLPIYKDGEGTPASDRYITRLHHLGHVSAEDVTNLLTRFKSKEGNVTADAPTNMLIMTDTGTQIRRMLSVIESIDLPRSGVQTWIEPIHYANAQELATRLLEIFPAEAAESTTASTPAAPAAARTARPTPRTPQTPEPATIGSPLGETTIRNIIADERTNSLIIIATERAYLRILEMIRQLDIQLEGEGKIHVHYVQNGAAVDIAEALNALIGASVSRTASGSRAAQRAGGQRAGTLASGTGTLTAQTALFEGEIRVTAYEPSNALVITSSLHDYASLRRVIERLDAPRRQVFIEAVVMELGVDRTTDLGLAFHGGAADFPTDGSLSIFGFNAPSSVDLTQNDLTGLALGVRGPTIENSQQLVGFSVPGFGVVVTALANSGDADVLSTPHIIAMDNVEAEISVGENIPLQTNGVAPGTFAGLGSFGALGTAAQSGTDLGQLGGIAGGFGSVARQDVGTTIRITPHINEDNEVRLEIQEEISEQGATSGTLGVVSINRRTARTEVMVRDQQTIVIGGLMRDAISNQEDKVPVLGDIPILGALFRRTSKQKRKTNLLLILTPYIIRDPGDLREIFERKMQERQQMIDRYFVFGEDKFEPHIDYSRTRGLVSEILNEIDEIEEQVRLAEAASLEPPPEHVPRSPIGEYTAPEDEVTEEEEIIIGPHGEERVYEPEPALPPTPADEQEGSSAPFAPPAETAQPVVEVPEQGATEEAPATPPGVPSAVPPPSEATEEPSPAAPADERKIPSGAADIKEEEQGAPQTP